MAKLSHVLLQFGEFHGVWEFVHADSRWVFIGPLEIVTDYRRCIRPWQQGGFAIAGKVPNEGNQVSRRQEGRDAFRPGTPGLELGRVVLLTEKPIGGDENVVLDRFSVRF